MEWTRTLRAAIDYMEERLREPVTIQEVADHVYLSPFYLQRGFEIVTGYTMARYLRCRRLYLAALDLAAGEEKVIDVAARYRFETPEGFTKAFTRFHGATPTQVRRDRRLIRAFLPLKIIIDVQGGETMEYTVERMEAFQIIGFERAFSMETAYGEIPAFWDEFSRGYLAPLMRGREPSTPQEEAVCRYRVGEFGVCLDDLGTERPGEFRYLIAGRYEGGPVPAGMTLFQFPAGDWAIFPCRGPMPGALQAVNTAIFQEWLPGNPDYEIALPANIEWYSTDDPQSPDCRSAIWLPVRASR